MACRKRGRLEMDPVTCRTACRGKTRLQSVGRCMCLDVCLSACRFKGLALMVYIFDVLLLGPAFCSPLVVSVRVGMFGLRPLGSGCSEGASGRTQIHTIWRTWHFRGEVFVSWLYQNGFVALKRRMMTRGLSSALVESPPGINLLCLNVWGICTTYPIWQTAWSQWLCWCRWMHWGCW